MTKKTTLTQTHMQKLNLSFGAGADPIRQQLREQGFKAPRETATWQRIADAIVLLRVQGYLPMARRQAALDKLMKTIWRRMLPTSRK